jgi:hypothetical protein
MSDEDPFTFSGDNIPNTNGAIVAARDESSTTSGESANGMIMALQMEFVIRIIFNILGRVVGILWTPILLFIRPGEPPDTETVISASGDDQRLLWPLFCRDDTLGTLSLYPLRFDDGQTPDGAGVTTKDVLALTGLEVPYPDGAIGGATNEGIFGGGKGPDATFMAVKRA